VSVSRETLSTCVSRETLERLDSFAALLTRWNARINLIGRQDEATLWERHIADSWQLTRLLPANATLGADFGSGAGFPGLIVSIVAGLTVHLVESDIRKAAFLQEAARITQAPAIVHAKRIEEAKIPPAHVVMARGLAPLSTLLALTFPHLAVGGVCLFLKGEKVEQEILAAQDAWTMRIERHISLTDRRGVILRLSEVTRA
jgi:16S rRNA (guanine527-N7)-methyltransferase